MVGNKIPTSFWLLCLDYIIELFTSYSCLFVRGCSWTHKCLRVLVLGVERILNLTTRDDRARRLHCSERKGDRGDNGKVGSTISIKLPRSLFQKVSTVLDASKPIRNSRGLSPIWNNFLTADIIFLESLVYYWQARIREDKYGKHARLHISYCMSKIAS